MKRRHGFVSNSSSSSFVVLLPDSLTLDDQAIQSAIEADGGDTDAERVEKAFATLQGGFSVWNCDNPNEVGVLRELLKDYIIASIGVSSDDGEMVPVSQNGIKKIKKILA